MMRYVLNFKLAIHGRLKHRKKGKLRNFSKMGNNDYLKWAKRIILKYFLCVALFIERKISNQTFFKRHIINYKKEL